LFSSYFSNFISAVLAAIFPAEITGGTFAAAAAARFRALRAPKD
jgi:hypothetical protein